MNHPREQAPLDWLPRPISDPWDMDIPPAPPEEEDEDWVISVDLDEEDQDLPPSSN